MTKRITLKQLEKALNAGKVKLVAGKRNYIDFLVAGNVILSVDRDSMFDGDGMYFASED